MDFPIAVLLMQDGITTGAIYALLALAFILVYSVTRIPFLPIGGFVTFTAMSLNQIQEGGVAWAASLLVILGVPCLIFEIKESIRRNTINLRSIVLWLLGYVGLGALLLLAAVWVAWSEFPLILQMIFVFLITVPLAPMIYRLAFQPIQDSDPLTLFMVSISIDMAMVGIALFVFGPDGIRNEPYSEAVYQFGMLSVPGYAVWIIGVTLVLVMLLFGFSTRTLEGKKLRATAVNRLGAQLVGISTSKAGMIAFALAGAIGVICGLLIGPVATINSSSGVLLGLKALVAAVLGGFASYPAAVLGAIVIGLIEAFSSFWVSALKDAIAFAFVIPILLMRSLTSHYSEDDH